MRVRLQERFYRGLKSGGIDDEQIDSHLGYFKGRYVEDGNPSYRFNHLHLRPNDNEGLVREVLLGNENAPENKLACCLIIILRFRNNYFHGIKWAYQFQDQRENFERSCSLLTYCLDKYAR